MEQFNLEKWLKDKSRKVVTRDGRLVRIICTDVISHFPIVAAIKLEVGNEFIQEYDLRGRASLSKNEDCDLFFADKKEELTEFEKAVEKIIPYKIPIDMLKSTSQQLLDIARKEIEKDIYDNGYRMGYDKGKEETLQSMPKWKKVISGLTRKELFNMMHKSIVTTFKGYKDYYYLDNADLKKLPKEE